MRGRGGWGKWLGFLLCVEIATDGIGRRCYNSFVVRERMFVVTEEVAYG